MPQAARTYQFSSGLLELPVPAGAPIVRIHQTIHGAVWFGPEPGKPPVYRFDAPAGPFRTLYGAAELTGAFVETVLRRARRIIAWPFVEQRQWTVLAPNRDLILAKVFDEGLAHHGVTADICAGDDYSASQQFAADLYATFGKVDGIAYRARHNNGQICYALFDRVDHSALKAVESHEFKDKRAIANEIMRRHGAVWDPLTPLPAP
jgi:hypothetical protein